MSLHEFVEWFRNDLAYKAPETWPGHVSWFLAELKNRYPNVAEHDDIRAVPVFEAKP